MNGNGASLIAVCNRFEGKKKIGREAAQREKAFY
jgi:hypothetical protein